MNHGGIIIHNYFYPRRCAGCSSSMQVRDSGFCGAQ
jgi:hypothetical protein